MIMEMTAWSLIIADLILLITFILNLFLRRRDRSNAEKSEQDKTVPIESNITAPVSTGKSAQAKAAPIENSVTTLVSVVLLVLPSIQGNFDQFYEYILAGLLVLFALANIYLMVLDIWREKHEDSVKAIFMAIPFIIIFGISAFSIWQSAQINDNTVVRFSDARFEKLAREILQVPYSEEITVGDLATVTDLTIAGESIIEHVRDPITGNVRQSAYTYKDVKYDDFGSINLDNLKYFPNLKSLAITNNDLKNQQTIEKLTNLEYLRLTNCNLQDIGFLNKCVNIRKLYLWDNPMITDIKPISSVKNLTSLNLGNTNPVDFSYIRDLKNLEFLGLPYCTIPDSDIFTNLHSLKNLNLSYCKLENFDAITASIEKLHTLENLYMAETGIESIAFLNNMRQKNLKLVNFNNNHISDITPVLALPKLETAWLQNNMLASVSCLVDLNPQTNVYLSGNPGISDMSTVSDNNKIHGLPIFADVTYARPIGLVFDNDDDKTIKLNGTKLTNPRKALDNNLWLPLELILNSFEYDIAKSDEENSWTISKDGGKDIVLYLKTGEVRTGEPNDFDKAFRMEGSHPYVTTQFVREVLGLTVHDMAYEANPTHIISIINKYYAIPRVEFVKHNGQGVELNVISPYGLDRASYRYSSYSENSLKETGTLPEGRHTISTDVSDGYISVYTQDKNGVYMAYRFDWGLKPEETLDLLA